MFKNRKIIIATKHEKEHVVIPINDFSKGIYILMIEGESFYKGQLFYKM